MASISSKINEFLHSPKTREMVDKAKAAANKPENRAKIKQVQQKFTSRAHGPGHNAPGSPPTAGGPTTGSTPSHPGSYGAEHGHAERPSGGFGSEQSYGERPSGGSGAGGPGERRSGSSDAGYGERSAGSSDADYGERSSSGYDADVPPGTGPADAGGRSGY
ncbi:hypothetical protein ND748_29320 [Frankia sp. AiPs1]|uniref:hypothetical protein n=1 Tax=Frankia sp. AiPs1 TaxID=573493 RepID=UPI0020432F74|nr:hypothetical protein [Frankia sp. AiPs1]MCM3925760.1 hypothetical protein [Frankia sp. AiPs1]